MEMALACIFDEEILLNFGRFDRDILWNLG